LANIKSQIKRNRQNDKRRLANRVYRGEARIAVKNARTAFDTDAPESKEELRKAVSALDKAVIKGVLHKNNAARRKSRLMKAFAAVKPTEAKAAVEEPKAEVASVAEPKSRRSTRAKAVEKPEPVVEKTEPKKKTTTSKAAAAKKPAKTTTATAPKKTSAASKKAPAKKAPAKKAPAKKAPAKKAPAKKTPAKK
jgi:small subunit ribosomal protein S20